MQQKVALTTAHFPATGRIADMGSGSGRGSWDLACLHPGLEVIGVDINPVAVASADASYRRGNLSYRVGDIADPLFPPGSLDAVLDSSVLHHVTSFTGFSTRRLEECLDHQVEALREGGVLVIRDFVVPDGPAEVRLDLPTGDGADDGEPAALSTAALFRRFAAGFRSSRNRSGPVPYRELGDAGDGWRRFALTLRSAHEFILRKDYRADWDVELREEYTYWTLDEFVRALERRRLRVVTAAPIRNPWIVANRWRGRVRLADAAGAPLPFPPTNVLVVGERVPARGAVRLEERSSARIDGPGFVRVHAWRHRVNGAVLELAERPGRTIDLLPWWREGGAGGGRVLVLARRGMPRPIVNAAASDAAILGARWSGHIAEPVAAIIADEPDDAAVARVLGERAGIASGAIARIDAPWRYLTSPGGIDERVAAYAVELREEPAVADGALRALDARQVLRACHVNGMFDARLELGCHRLLRRLALDPGPWIGATPAPPLPAEGIVPAADALTPPASAPYERIAADGSAGRAFLEARRGVFDEVSADGSVVATLERDYVMPRGFSRSTVSVLPYAALADGDGAVVIGVEWRELPAAQAFCGSAAIATVPAWRVPREVADGDALVAFARTRLARDFAASGGEPTELGGPYLASPGVTPELVHPYALAVTTCGGPQLRWIRLSEALARTHELVDAHLAIAVHRLGHALGVR